MNYRTNPRNGDRISILSFGCMRFHKDEHEVERQVRYAIEQGVNYFDTAYIYPRNEQTLGRVLHNLGKRDQVKIATKLPPYLVRKSEDFEKLFQTQCKRLQTDYIDYYLIHMLPGVHEWKRLVDLGIPDWITQKKRDKQICNIGFSYHGGAEDFKLLIDVYAWDFCMMQYNYYDEHNQAGVLGLRYAAGKGVPVMIMEPLRGGRLAMLPKEAAVVWRKDADSLSADETWSPAQRGLFWVWNHNEVLTVLSGMNSMDMLEENIAAASKALPNMLSEQELLQYENVRSLLMGNTNVPCTGCGYCMPCPHKVDIPQCFSIYNDIHMIGGSRARFNYILRVNGHYASLCKQCGACEQHCPQNIKIRDSLRKVTTDMEKLPYRAIRAVMRKFMKMG